jgi:ATP-binding cassette subfamily B protein RaxB
VPAATARPQAVTELWPLSDRERAGDALACLDKAAELLHLEDYRPRADGRRSLPGRALNADDVVVAARKAGLLARIVQWGPAGLQEVATPAILPLENGGYLLLAKSPGFRSAKIFDPGHGWRRMSLSALQQWATGFAIEIAARPDVRPRAERPSVRAWSLVRWSGGIRGGIIQAILVSLFLQAYTAVSPMYLRVVVDEAATGGGRDLLLTAALGFGLLAIFNGLATFLRGVILQNLNNELSQQMTLTVFSHMMTLPLRWFQSRRMGDILSRLQGVDHIRGALTGLLGAAFEVPLALIMLVMLIFIAPPMLLLVLGEFVVTALMRAVMLPLGVHLNSRAVVAGAAEEGKRIETLRGIQSIKAMGREQEQESEWFGYFLRTLLTTRRNSIYALAFGGTQGLVGSLTFIIAVYLGGSAVIAGTMSVGMLTAALAYMGQFNQSLSTLFQQYMSWRMLDVQLGRVSDIVLSPAEPRLHTDDHGPQTLFDGSIRAEGVGFRYEASSRQVLKNLDISIADGEHVAVVGRSGAGKSTLLKVLSGLYPPDEGTIIIGGLDLETVGPRPVRDALGVVMQGDELFAGTIADNVAFFERQADVAWLWECLVASQLAEDVERMPLKEHTLIGDMGAALSGGQKQRLLIARALYRRPRILLLDEATSHLDQATEARVLDSLSKMAATRLVVAHRPSTIAAADRVLEFRNGALHEVKFRKSNAP